MNFNSTSKYLLKKVPLSKSNQFTWAFSGTFLNQEPQPYISDGQLIEVLLCFKVPTY